MSAPASRRQFGQLAVCLAAGSGSGFWSRRLWLSIAKEISATASRIFRKRSLYWVTSHKSLWSGEYLNCCRGSAHRLRKTRSKAQPRNSRAASWSVECIHECDERSRLRLLTLGCCIGDLALLFQTTSLSDVFRISNRQTSPDRAQHHRRRQCSIDDDVSIGHLNVVTQIESLTINDHVGSDI